MISFGDVDGAGDLCRYRMFALCFDCNVLWVVFLQFIKEGDSNRDLWEVNFPCAVSSIAECLLRNTNPNIGIMF